MKFIILTIASQIFMPGAKFKNEIYFDSKFETQYIKLENIKSVGPTVRVEVFNVFHNQFFYHDLCEIRTAENDTIVSVKNSCESLVEEINRL